MACCICPLADCSPSRAGTKARRCTPDRRRPNIRPAGGRLRRPRLWRRRGDGAGAAAGTACLRPWRRPWCCFVPLSCKCSRILNGDYEQPCRCWACCQQSRCSWAHDLLRWQQWCGLHKASSLLAELACKFALQVPRHRLAQGDIPPTVQPLQPTGSREAQPLDNRCQTCAASFAIVSQTCTVHLRCALDAA